MKSKRIKFRKCYYCQRELEFNEFYNANMHNYSNEELEKLWHNSYLKFYCCTCFDEEYYREEAEEIKKNIGFRQCCRCNSSLSFYEFREILFDLSLKTIIYTWKNLESEIYCKKCFFKKREEEEIKRKILFLENNAEYIERVMNPLVQEEKQFIKDLIKEIGNIIPVVRHLYITNKGFTLKEGRISGLVLTGRYITTIPESIGNLTNLRYLNLSSNKLRELPDSIGNLTALRVLRLGGNRLKKLPYTLANLSSLMQLHLNSNHFFDVPICIGALSSLRYIDLSRNHINDLPEFLGFLPELKTIYILCRYNCTVPISLKQIKRLMIIK